MISRYMHSSIVCCGVVLSVLFLSDAHSFEIISPNGNEAWTAGSPHTIQWNPSGASGGIQIQPYLNGVAQPNLAASAPNTGSLEWNIPEGYPPGTTYKISISAQSGSVSDFSNNNFRIEAPQVNGTKTSFTPNAGGTGVIRGSVYGSCPTGANHVLLQGSSPGQAVSVNGFIGQSAYIDACGEPGYINLYRQFLPFNTYSIPDNATVTRATLHFSTTLRALTEDADFFLSIVQSTQASTTALSVHDFSKVQSTSGGESFEASTIPSGIDYAIPLNNTGLSWINKYGWTKLALRSTRDISATKPTDTTANNWANEMIGFVKNFRLEVEYSTPSVLSSIVISGTNSLDENTSTQFTGTAHYNDGTNSDETNNVSWSLSSAYASVNGTGFVSANTVTADKTARLVATFNGKSDTHDFTVKNSAGVNFIQILGATQVGESSTAQYQCIAHYMDGTTADVTKSATWSEDSGFTVIGEFTGFLTSSAVGADEALTVSAIYSGKNDQLAVTIKDAAPLPPNAPSLTTPAGDAIVYTNQVTFDWNSVSGATGYRFQITKVGGGWAHDPDDLPSLQTSETVNLPFPGSYIWRAMAKNGTDNWGPWSAQRTVYIREPINLTHAQGNQDNAGDPVNTATGAYLYSREDISVPGRGLPFEFARFYNSRISGSTVMGEKWRHTYLVDLVDQSGEVTITWANGSQDILTEFAGGVYASTYYGFSGTLTKHPNTTYDFLTKGLVTYHFDTLGKLLTISDRNSNTITLSYDGQNNIDYVTDTVGRTFDFQYDGNDNLSKIVDPLTREWLYTVDGQGDLASFTDARGNSMAFTYDGSHNMTVIQDRRGNTMLTNVFDGDGRVTSQTNARGKAWGFAYTLAGVTTVTDPDTEDTVYEYNDRFWLLKRTDPDAGFEQYEYDDDGNRTRVTNKRGYETTFSYDDRGNLIESIDALLGTTVYEYSDEDQLALISDALARSTAFEYDPLGNLVKTIRPLSHETDFAYDANGQLITLNDALSRVTDYGYDSEGNRTSISNALGETTQFQFDAVGRLTQITEPNTETTVFTYTDNDTLATVTDQESNQTVYSYDENDNRTTIQNPRVFTTTTGYDVNNNLESIEDTYTNSATFGYDNLDRLISQTDRRNKTFAFEYDAMGNRTKSIDALLKETILSYDSVGNQIGITNANSNPTSFGYDALNRLFSVADALANQTQYEYDAVGRMTKMTDANGSETLYEYDVLDRLIRVTDAETGTAEYAYDLNGNRLSITDPNSNTTLFAYDDLNRLVSESDSLSNTTTYTYDTVGNLNTRTDGRGNVTTYTFDGAHRLTLVSYPDASTVAFTYDANGNRTQMTDVNGTTTWVYDNLDRITQVTDPFSNVVGYGYDVDSNRTTITYPGSKTATYAFDDNGRLDTLTDWVANVFDYDYDFAGNITTLTYPSGAKEIRSYYANERLDTLTHQKTDTTPFIDYKYYYDATGNITGMDRQESVEREFEKELTNYTYNSANEILTAEGTNYTFDADGNQTSETNGNGTSTFDFDFENRLTQIDPPGADLLLFDYNGVGDRLNTTDQGTETRYLLDVNKPLTDVLADLDNANSPQQFYLYGIGLVGRVTPGGDLYQYHPDHLGSIMAVSYESTDTTTAAYAYDEFGAAHGASGTELGPWRFGGAIGAVEHGNWSFLRARFLEKSIGRFLSEDHWQLRRGTQSLNAFSYVANDPLTNVDPSGRIIEVLGSENFRKQVWSLMFELVSGPDKTAGKELVGFLNESKSIVQITTVNSSFSTSSDWGVLSGNVSDGNVSNIIQVPVHRFWSSPFEKTIVPGRDTGIPSIDPLFALAHELGHAYGNIKFGTPDSTGNLAEEFAVGIANLIRREHGKSELRGQYAGNNIEPVNDPFGLGSNNAGGNSQLGTPQPVYHGDK